MKLYYPWVMAITGMLLLMVSNGLVSTGISAFDSSLLAEFGWSRGALKFRDLLTLMLTGLLAPLLGALIDRFGPRALALVGLLLLAALYFSYSQIHLIGQIYLIHIGFAVVLVTAGLNVAVIMVSQWFVTKRGVALGITVVGSSLGGAIVPMVIVAMLPALGWRESFMWLSALPLALCVLVLLLVRTPAQMNMRPYGADGDTQAETARVVASDLSDIGFATALRTRTFWVLVVVALATYYSLMAVAAHLFLHMRGMQFDPVAAGRAMAVMFGMGVIGKLMFGSFADYFNPKRVFLANLFIMICGALLLATLKPALIWYALILFGIGWGGLYTMIQLLAVNAFGLSSAGKILGTITLFDASAAGLGVWVTALLFDHFGSYQVAFNVICGLTVLAFFAATQARDERKHLAAKQARNAAAQAR
jgi:sugar phosphate permease